MSYNFSYTGNPISNNNPQSIGFRYSTTTSGFNYGAGWYYEEIPISSYPDPSDPTKNITIQEGTYLIQSSVISVNNTDSPVANALYIVGNKTATEDYYVGGMVTCDASFNHYNQSTPSLPGIDNLGYIIPQTGGEPYFTFCPPFANNNWVVLSGSHEYNLPPYEGTTLSTSAIFTYSKTPSQITYPYGVTSPPPKPGTYNFAAICWYMPMRNDVYPNYPIAYNTITRIA